MTDHTQRDWPYPGSRWWKFDFHTHTPASTDTYWAKASEPLAPEEWLLRYMAAEIDCLAITDHNSGAWIDHLKAAYDRMQEQADRRTPPEDFGNCTSSPASRLPSMRVSTC